LLTQPTNNTTQNISLLNLYHGIPELPALHTA
jgi:hypothetical protein